MFGGTYAVLLGAPGMRVDEGWEHVSGRKSRKGFLAGRVDGLGGFWVERVCLRNGSDGDSAGSRESRRLVLQDFKWVWMSMMGKR